MISNDQEEPEKRLEATVFDIEKLKAMYEGSSVVAENRTWSAHKYKDEILLFMNDGYKSNGKKVYSLSFNKLKDLLQFFA